ncbi:MAG: PaaI family thioesterase [Raoultibacter sp.]
MPQDLTSLDENPSSMQHIVKDRFASGLGMEVIEARPGYGVARLVIDDQHLNAVDTVHGGVFFTLADYAFGAATTNFDNETVTLTASIDYIATGPKGTVFTAVAKEIAATRRTSRYDAEVRDETGKLMATAHFVGYRKG